LFIAWVHIELEHFKIKKATPPINCYCLRCKRNEGLAVTETVIVITKQHSEIILMVKLLPTILYYSEIFDRILSITGNIYRKICTWNSVRNRYWQSLKDLISVSFLFYLYVCLFLLCVNVSDHYCQKSIIFRSYNENMMIICMFISKKNYRNVKTMRLNNFCIGLTYIDLYGLYELNCTF
jgi:hypothetical protein